MELVHLDHYLDFELRHDPRARRTGGQPTR